ncbi:hypothetical protein DWX10_25935 [Clostridium sp. AF18-27]|nr:hypothetical protein DWX10_25935 [Clostridium sp. AF18-27]
MIVALEVLRYTDDAVYFALWAVELNVGGLVSYGFYHWKIQAGMYFKNGLQPENACHPLAPRRIPGEQQFPGDSVFQLEE